MRTAADSCPPWGADVTVRVLQGNADQRAGGDGVGRGRPLRPRCPGGSRRASLPLLLRVRPPIDFVYSLGVGAQSLLLFGTRLVSNETPFTFGGCHTHRLDLDAAGESGDDDGGGGIILEALTVALVIGCDELVAVIETVLYSNVDADNVGFLSFSEKGGGA